MDQLKAALLSGNSEITLGMIGQKLIDIDEANTKDHDEFRLKLKEGDQYFAVFKLSRCAFSWASKNGICRMAAYAVGFIILDEISRVFYWNIVPSVTAMMPMRP